MSCEEYKKTKTMLPNADSFSRSFFRITGKSAKSVTFIVTENCQLRCSYCYQPHKNCEHDMSLETGKKIVDFLFEQDAQNSKLINEEEAYGIIIDFIGGEPLLKINLIKDIMLYFVNKAIKLKHRWATNYMISLSSNGVAFFDKDVQNFLKIFDGKVSIGITLDGNKQLHDSCRRFKDGSPSFDLAQKAFKEVLRRGLNNTTKLTISPTNLPYLTSAVKEMMCYQDLRELYANPVFEEDWTKEQGKSYYYQLKEIGDWLLDTEKYKSVGFSILGDPNMGSPMSPEDNNCWCGGTGKMLAFDCKGDIYPCLRYHPLTLSSRREAIYKLGNIYTGFLKTEKEMKMIDCLECITRRSKSTDKCFNCPIANGCAYCSGWDFDKFGDPNIRATGICNMHKGRALANNYFWNMLYRKEGLDNRIPLSIPDDWALEIIDKKELDMLKSLSQK